MDMDMDMDGKFHIHGKPAHTPTNGSPGANIDKITTFY